MSQVPGLRHVTYCSFPTLFHSPIVFVCLLYRIKRGLKGGKAEGAGVIKDKELKVEEPSREEASQTLDGAGEGRVKGRGKGIGCICICS
jgi:hypothetical protein